jgi:hypothetical protein
MSTSFRQLFEIIPALLSVGIYFTSSEAPTFQKMLRNFRKSARRQARDLTNQDASGRLHDGLSSFHNPGL